MARSSSPMQERQEVGTFDTLVQEEQSLKERMQARLTEITPAVQEAEQIKAWLAEHAGQNGATAQAPAPDPAPAPQGQAPTRRGGRREQFLTVVRQHPDGIKVADVAKELGLPPTYFYRLSADLKKAGLVKDGPNGGVVAA